MVIHQKFQDRWGFNMKIIVINDNPKPQRPQTLDGAICNYRRNVDRELGFKGWARRQSGGSRD